MSKIEWKVCDVSFKPDVFINVIRKRIYFSKYLRDLCLNNDFRFIKFFTCDAYFGFKFLKESDINSLSLILTSKESMICYSTFICNMLSQGKHQVFYDNVNDVYYIKYK